MTALEMGFLAPGFLLLLLGGFEVGRYCFVSESLHHFVGEVARATIVNPDASAGELKSTLLQRASILQADRLNLAVAVNRASAPTPTVVRVTATYNHFVQYGEARSTWSGFFQPINADITLSFVVP